MSTYFLILATGFLPSSCSMDRRSDSSQVHVTDLSQKDDSSEVRDWVGELLHDHNDQNHQHQTSVGSPALRGDSSQAHGHPSNPLTPTNDVLDDPSVHFFESLEIGNYSSEDLEWLKQIERTNESIDILPAKPGKATPTHYSEEEKMEAVAAYLERVTTEELSMAAFAKERGIHPRTFNNWIRKNREASSIQSTATKAGTFLQDQVLPDQFYSIMAQEGRLLKPHTLGLSDHAEADEKRTFLYQTVGDRNQESIQLVLPDYQLPDIQTGGPGIAPVATMENQGLAILTDKITGDYTHIPRTKEGGRWEKMKNPGYAEFIKILQSHLKLNSDQIQDSVMAFVPNWIKPKHFYIMYEDTETSGTTDKTGKTYLNYKCLQYDFEDQGYAANGIEFNGFRDCSTSK